MIAFVGSANWDKSYNHFGELVSQGPGGGTLNTLSWITNTHIKALLVSQHLSVMQPLMQELYSTVSVLSTVEVDKVHEISVHIDRYGNRAFKVPNPTNPPFPKPPKDLKDAKVIDWNRKIDEEYTPYLKGMIVASMKQSKRLIDVGIKPTLIIESMDHYDKPDEDWLKDSGCRWCIMTDGKNGSWAWDNEWTHYPTKHVDAVDTTGCGDAFRAGMCFGLHEDLGLKESIRIASNWGADCATLLGAQRFVERF